MCIDKIIVLIVGHHSTLLCDAYPVFYILKAREHKHAKVHFIVLEAGFHMHDVHVHSRV